MGYLSTKFSVCLVLESRIMISDLPFFFISFFPISLSLSLLLFSLSMLHLCALSLSLCRSVGWLRLARLLVRSFVRLFARRTHTTDTRNQPVECALAPCSGFLFRWNIQRWSSQTSRTYHIWMANYSLDTRHHFYVCTQILRKCVAINRERKDVPKPKIWKCLSAFSCCCWYIFVVYFYFISFFFWFASSSVCCYVYNP